MHFAGRAGFSQGVRRSVGGLATILGPLWAGGLIDNMYIMMGVMMALLVLLTVSNVEENQTNPFNYTSENVLKFTKKIKSFSRPGNGKSFFVTPLFRRNVNKWAKKASFTNELWYDKIFFQIMLAFSYERLVEPSQEEEAESRVIY